MTPDGLESAGAVLLWNTAIPFVASLSACAAAVGLCSEPMRKLDPGAHWTEVARAYWPVRTAGTIASVWVVLAAMFAFKEQFLLPGRAWLAPVIFLASLGGCIIGRKISYRGLHIPATARAGGVRAILTRQLSYPGPILLCTLIALTWQDELGLRALLITAAVFVLGVLLVLGGSSAILRFTGLARPAGSELEGLSRELVAEAGAPLRHVLVLDLPMANAFAFFATKDLAFTPSLLSILDEAELKAVIRHEIGHLKESVIVLWLRMPSLLGYLLLGLVPAAIRSGGPLNAVPLILIWFFISRIATRLHRTHEQAADDHALGGKAADPAYARALEKIHEAGLIPALIAKRHAYPSLGERMLAAGVAPDFPEPAPPSPSFGVLCAVLAVGIFFFLCSGLAWVAETLLDYWPG